LAVTGGHLDACPLTAGPRYLRRYIGLDILARCRLTTAETSQPEEVPLTAITA
jgi:hypothetical protein